MIAASPTAELSQAFALVNRRFFALTGEQQEQVELISTDPIDEAILEGDDDRAFAVIAGWCSSQLAEIHKAART